MIIGIVVQIMVDFNIASLVAQSYQVRSSTELAFWQQCMFYGVVRVDSKVHEVVLFQP